MKALMGRKMKLIVGNFKMNLLYNDIKNYLKEITKYNFDNVVYCPSNIYLKTFIDNGLVVGAQDVSRFENGPYTGDISASQFKELGVKYAIIGHSERRMNYQENDYLYNKLDLCIKSGLIPILCIGETHKQYLKKETLIVLERQLTSVLRDLDVSKIIFAYEPIWSIGTGLLPTNNEIEKVIDYIKKYIYNNYELESKVLYGGSVNEKNIEQLEMISNIDGYLVGGCSIKSYNFLNLIKLVNKF